MTRSALLACVSLCLSVVACAPSPRGEPRSSHGASHDGDGDGDGDHDDHDGALPEMPTDAVTMAAAQRLSVTPGALHCPTEILGVVDVHDSGGSEEHALQALRVRAVMIGAEALTNVEFRHGDKHEKLHLSGTAVRCRDILKGRRYDVLERLDIVATMGHEEEAFEELRARGRAVGANVILDVHFEHGDESHMRITGKAVHAHDP